MESEQCPQDTCTPAVPPTVPGALPQIEARSKWPTVLGCIAIVFGVLGAMGGAWGLIADRFMSGFVQNQPPEMLAEFERMRGWMAVIGPQGQRTLNPLCGKDFHEELVVPAGDLALSLDAVV